jgi:cation transport protein ChaC
MVSSDIWIFGYGSLMWDPGFAFAEARPALVHGWHRAFCVVSHHYRGTKEKPGLVLGLARGGACRGRAFRVSGARAEATLAYLHEREMVHYVYVFREVKAELPDGRRISANTYVADTAHDRYCGALPLEQTAAMIAAASGISGSNVEYLENTICHLDALGIREGALHRVLAAVRRLSSQPRHPQA